MQEQQPSAPPLALPGAGWPDWRWLVLLLLLTTGMRFWQLWHTEVPSRDSIGFIHIAWQLEHADWREAFRTAHQHPGYPALLLAVSRIVRPLAGEDHLVWAMQFSGQLVSAFASVLLVVPMYYLGKALFDGRVGFWAALLFQCVPATGKLMADGLSEPLFLLLLSTSVVLALRGFRTGSAWSFALAGGVGGLAYLTRAEGALVPMCAGVVLLAGLVVRRWRATTGDHLRCGVALSATALLVAAPYMVIIQGVTVKPTAAHMVGKRAGAPAPVEPEPGVARSLPFAVWRYEPAVRPEDRYLWGLQALGSELGKSFFYVLWAPALLGLVWFRDRFRLPGAWSLLLLCLVLAGLLYRVAQTSGYMGTRHGAIILLLGLYWAVAGVAVLGAWPAKLLPRLRPEVVTLAFLVGLAVAPLSNTLATLHADRAAFRQAGVWLAQHAGPDDDVVDPYTWAGYYAGRLFVERPAQPAVWYVVMEKSDNEHPHLWHHMAEAKFLASLGQVVQRFPVPRRRKPGEVVVYRVERR